MSPQGRKVLSWPNDNPNLFVNWFILVIYLPFHQNFCNILPGGRHPAGPTKLINLLIFWAFLCLEGGIRLLNKLKRWLMADNSAFNGPRRRESAFYTVRLRHCVGPPSCAWASRDAQEAAQSSSVAFSVHYNVVFDRLHRLAKLPGTSQGTSQTLSGRVWGEEGWVFWWNGKYMTKINQFTNKLGLSVIILLTIPSKLLQQTTQAVKKLILPCRVRPGKDSDCLHVNPCPQSRLGHSTNAGMARTL